MSKEEATAKEKTINADYTKAKEQYDKDKKAAEAAKKTFDKPAPMKASLTILPGEYQNKEAANAALQKMQAEKDKEKKAKDAKEKGGDTPKPSDPSKGKH